MGWLQKIFAGTPKVMPTSANDETFDALIAGSDLPIVIDFWSPTCGPCRTLEPVIIDLATTYQGKVLVVEVNTAQATAAARRFSVMATPTVVYLRGGREVERVVGFRGSLYHKEVIDTELLGDVEASEPTPAS